MKDFVKRIGRTLKDNIYYVMLVLCVAAIGTLVTVSLINENNQSVPTSVDVDKPTEIVEPVVDPVEEDVIFVSPVVGTIIEDYSDSVMVFLSTLNEYGVHTAIDYGATAGTKVSSVYKGTVSEVGSNLLDGKYVVIDHGDGLTTVYMSLGETSVSVGDSVQAGDKIGTVGNSGIREYESGDHLHFVVEQDGAVINPYLYLAEDNK